MTSRGLGDDTALVTFHVGERGRRTLMRAAPDNRWRIVHLHGSSTEPADGGRR